MRDEDQKCINADNASDCDELEYTRYSCDFVTPNRFSVLDNVIEDEMSVIPERVKSAASFYNRASCQPCERSHKCFNCSDSCQDFCEFAICLGPMTMKKFINQDFTKLYNDKHHGFDSLTSDTLAYKEVFID